MSFSSSFRDKPRLSDRLRGKSGDELFNELRKEFDQDRKFFFNSPSGSPTSNSGSTTGSTFPRAGHLFEEPSMRRHFNIKSHLEDLAQRHPEFADQLHYPAWSNDSRSNTWGRKRRGSGQAEPGEASKQHQQEPAQYEHQQPEPEEQAPPRGRPKDNLRSTVPDMGQKQQETEDNQSRGQRSWSAPPDNRQQQDKPRFVSKIEITPVNPDAPQTQTGDATKPPMAPPKPQPQPHPQQQQQPQSQSQPKSTVRHIPIFVEGRDEPVLPKNVEPEFTQSQAPPQHFSRPPPQPHFTPSQQQFHQQTPLRKQTPPQFEQYPSPPRNQPSHSPPQPHFEQPPPHQPEPQQQQAPPVNPRDPFYIVGCVQKEVDELRAQIDSFSGNSRADKQYILLDELLTRNLIKLDNVETEGKEELRALRKNAIRTIQKCISVLESKVPVPGSENVEGGENTENIMDVDKNLESKLDDTVNSQGDRSVEDQSQKAAECQRENTPTKKSSSNSRMEVEHEKSQETNPSGAIVDPRGEDKKGVTSEANTGVGSSESAA